MLHNLRQSGLERLDPYFGHIFCEKELRVFYKDRNKQLHAWLSLDQNREEREIIHERLKIVWEDILKAKEDEANIPEWKGKWELELNCIVTRPEKSFALEDMEALAPFVTQEVWEEVKRDGMLVFERLTMAQFFKLLHFVSTDELQRIFDYQRTPLKLKYVLELVQSAQHPAFLTLLRRAFATGLIKEMDHMKAHFKDTYKSLAPQNRKSLLKMTSNRELIAIMAGEEVTARLLIKYRDKELDAKADRTPEEVLKSVQDEQKKTEYIVKSGRRDILGFSFLRSHPDFLLCAEKHVYVSKFWVRKVFHVEICQQDEPITHEVIANLKRAKPDLNQADLDSIQGSSKRKAVEQEGKLKLKQQCKVQEEIARHYLSLSDTRKKGDFMQQRQSSEELIPFSIPSVEYGIRTSRGMGPQDQIYFYHGFDEQVFWFTKSEETTNRPEITLNLLDKGAHCLSQVQQSTITPESSLYAFLTGASDLPQLMRQINRSTRVDLFHQVVPTLVRTEQNKVLIVYSDFKFSEGHPTTHFYDVEQGKEVAHASAASIFLGFYRKLGGVNRALFYLNPFVGRCNLSDLEKVKQFGGKLRKSGDKQTVYPEMYEVDFDAAKICQSGALQESLDLIPDARAQCEAILQKINEAKDSNEKDDYVLDENWVFNESTLFSNSLQRHCRNIVRVCLVSRTNACFELVLQDLSTDGKAVYINRNEQGRFCCSQIDGENQYLFVQKLKQYETGPGSLTILVENSSLTQLGEGNKHIRVGLRGSIGHDRVTECCQREDGTLLVAIRGANNLGPVFVQAIKLQYSESGGKGRVASNELILKTSFNDATYAGPYFYSYLGSNELLVSNMVEPNQPDFIFHSSCLKLIKSITVRSNSSSTWQKLRLLTQRLGTNADMHELSIKFDDSYSPTWAPSLSGLKVEYTLLAKMDSEMARKLTKAEHIVKEDAQIVMIGRDGAETHERKKEYSEYFESSEGPIKQMLKDGCVLVAQVHESTRHTKLLFSSEGIHFNQVPSRNSGRILGFRYLAGAKTLIVLDEELNFVKYKQIINNIDFREEETRNLSQVDGLRQSVMKLAEDEQVHIDETHIIIGPYCHMLEARIDRISCFRHGDIKVFSGHRGDSVMFQLRDVESLFIIKPNPSTRSLGFQQAEDDYSVVECFLSPSKLLRRINRYGYGLRHKWVISDVFSKRPIPISASLLTVLEQLTVEVIQQWMFVPQLDGSKLLLIHSGGIHLVRFDFEGNFVRHSYLQTTEAQQVYKVHVNEQGRVVVLQPEEQSEGQPSQSAGLQKRDGQRGVDTTVIAKHESYPETGLTITRLYVSKTYRAAGQWEFCLANDYLVILEYNIAFHLKLDPTQRIQKLAQEQRVKFQGQFFEWEKPELCQNDFGPNFKNQNLSKTTEAKGDGNQAGRVQIGYRLFEVTENEFSLIRVLDYRKQTFDGEQHVPMDFDTRHLVEEPNERSLYIKTEQETNECGIFRMYSELDLIGVQSIMKECKQRGKEPTSIDKRLLLASFQGATFFSLFQDQIKVLQAVLEMFTEDEADDPELQTKGPDQAFLSRLTAVLLRPQRKQPTQAEKELKKQEEKKAQKEEAKLIWEALKEKDRLAVVKAKAKAKQLARKMRKALRDRSFKSLLRRNIGQVVLRDILIRFGRLNHSFSIFDAIHDQTDFGVALSSWSPLLNEEMNLCFKQTKESKHIKALELHQDLSVVSFTRPNGALTKEEVQKAVQEMQKKEAGRRNRDCRRRMTCGRWKGCLRIKPQQKVINRKKVVNVPVHVYIFDLAWMKRGKKSFAELTQAFETRVPNSVYETKLVEYLMNEYWRRIYSKLFRYYFLSYLLLLVSVLVYCFTALVDKEDNDKHRNKIIAGTVFILLQWVWQLILEIYQIAYMYNQGNLWLYATVWNMLDLYLVVLPLELIENLKESPEPSTDMEVEMEQSKEVSRFGLALVTLLLLVKMFDWMRLLESTSFYIELIKATLKDMRDFTRILFYTIVTFGVPLAILDLHRDADTEVIKSVSGYKYIDMLLNQYLVILGDFNLDNFGEGEGGELKGITTLMSYTLFIAATYISQITMLNMLIAIMGDTFERVVENRKVNSVKTKMSLTCDQANFLNSVCSTEGSAVSEFLYVVVRDQEEGATSADETWQGPFSKMTRTLQARVKDLEHNITVQTAHQFKEIQKGQQELEARLKEQAQQLAKQQQERDKTLAECMKRLEDKLNNNCQQATGASIPK